jgi:hypothetical protein
MEQTKLQKIIEQKADQIRGAIEQAIDEGAKVQKNYVNCATIDEIFLQKDNRNDRFAIVLHFESEKIAKLLEPSKECLEKLAEQKRRELEEIEKQIKEKEAKDETDHN